MRVLTKVIAAAIAVHMCTPTCPAQTVYFVHPVVGGSDNGGLTGVDTQVNVGASDANPGTDPAAPLRTLGPSGLQNKLPPFVAYVAGRFYTPDALEYAFFKE